MQRIDQETRREILQEKLRGATNREVSDKFGVSTGMVSNVIDEARQGKLGDIEPLEDNVDELLDLGKRLKAAELDLRAAQTGLDVLDWLDDLGMEPDQIRAFRDELDELTVGTRKLDAYGHGVLSLIELKERTGYDVDGRLDDLIVELAEFDENQLRRIETITRKTTDLDEGIVELETAIDRSVDLTEFGFELADARALAADLNSLDGEDGRSAIERLSEVYQEYDQLERAVQDLRTEKESLEVDVEQLQSTRSDLKADTERLEASLNQVESTLQSVQDSVDELNETSAKVDEQIDRRRERLQSLEDEVETKRDELEALQEEREVVHAYRRFIADAELSDILLRDIGHLLDIESAADTAHLESYKSDIRERTISELRDVAFEMLEGEQMMPVAEHERKLREKGDTERILEELEEERQAVLTFMDFLDTGEISERLLKELRDLKRGMINLPEFSEERKSREVRDFLVKQLEVLTEGEAVITERRHRELLEEERSRHREELDAVIESFEQLTAFIHQLPMFFDEEWRVEIAQQVVETLDDTHDRVSVEKLQEAFQEVIADEFEERLDFDSGGRVVEGEVKESGVGLGSVVNSWIQHSNSDEE